MSYSDKGKLFCLFMLSDSGNGKLLGMLKVNVFL